MTLSARNLLLSLDTNTVRETNHCQSLGKYLIISTPYQSKCKTLWTPSDSNNQQLTTRCGKRMICHDIWYAHVLVKWFETMLDVTLLQTSNLKISGYIDNCFWTARCSRLSISTIEYIWVTLNKYVLMKITQLICYLVLVTSHILSKGSVLLLSWDM